MTWDELLRPFEFEFFRNGIYVATIAGALCGFVGCYVVLRNMSYIGHGLSHSIFGGYAVAGLAGVNLFLGAGIWGVVTALAVGGIVRRRPIGSDAAIGVVTTASFALGLALVQLYGSPGRNADGEHRAQQRAREKRADGPMGARETREAERHEVPSTSSVGWFTDWPPYGWAWCSMALGNGAGTMMAR